MNVHEIADLFRKRGSVTIEHAGARLTLEMHNRHERLYAVKLLTEIPYPQADIDTKLAHHFVRKGDRVLDAGANIGFTALEFIEAGACHVTALEPISTLFSRLKELRSEALTALPYALTSTIGSARMYVSEAHNQGSSLLQAVTDYFPGVFGLTTEEVSLTTIDALMKQGAIFDVWKLDIEGAEVDALIGAEITLEECPPRTIIAEVYDPFLESILSIMPEAFSFVAALSSAQTMEASYFSQSASARSPCSPPQPDVCLFAFGGMTRLIRCRGADEFLDCLCCHSEIPAVFSGATTAQ